METNPHKIFQQSVTMTAKMWPQGSNQTVSQGVWDGGWRVPPHHWPLLVAAFCGGALILLLAITAVLWHFCVAPHRNKDYNDMWCSSTDFPGTNNLPSGQVAQIVATRGNNDNSSLELSLCLQRREGFIHLQERRIRPLPSDTPRRAPARSQRKPQRQVRIGAYNVIAQVNSVTEPAAP